MSNHADAFSIQQMCGVFGVARSGYYEWLRKGRVTQRSAADAALTEQIRAVFEQSSGTYGSPRIYAELKSQGVCCSRIGSQRTAGLCFQLPSPEPCVRVSDTVQDDV
jgi:hypothetical protein